MSGAPQNTKGKENPYLLHTVTLRMAGFSGYWNSLITLRPGKKHVTTDLAISTRMQGAKCLSCGKLMKVFSSQSILLLRLHNFSSKKGWSFVLTERFCQDSLEEYFGHQRKLGRRNDNPDIRAFGYNNNAIRIQRQVSCQSGNTRKRKDRTRAWEQVTDDPIPCKKKVIRHWTLFNFLYY